MPYTVSIDKDVCISSGKCVADAPTAFRFDDDELAEPISEHPPLSDAALLDIGRNCPSGAITVYDDQGAPLDLD
jgi:ferredoxin